MPKLKKTRKQKALADLRRKSEPKTIQTAAFEAKPQTREEHVSAPAAITSQPTRPTANRAIITADYKYLAGDLRKTLFLTGAIIVLELVLKFGLAI